MRFLAVDVTLDNGFEQSQPRFLFESQGYQAAALARNFDLAPDGDWFVFRTSPRWHHPTRAR